MCPIMSMIRTKSRGETWVLQIPELDPRARRNRGDSTEISGSRRRNRRKEASKASTRSISLCLRSHWVMPQDLQRPLISHRKTHVCGYERPSWSLWRLALSSGMGVLLLNPKFSGTACCLVYAGSTVSPSQVWHTKGGGSMKIACPNCLSFSG